MKDLILFAACDRFNFGDMLMPMAVGRYLEKNHPSLLEEYQLRFASLSRSDMSDRDCLPTESIVSICEGASENAALIVAGGEVVGAKRADLFMHNSRSDAEHAEKSALRKNNPAEFSQMMISDFGNIWEYPYLPPKSCLPAGGRIFHNAIGGRLDQRKVAPSDVRWQRFSESDYISTRDTRLKKSLEHNAINSVVAPCSVSLLAEGYFSDLDSGSSPCDDPYFVFQTVYNDQEGYFDELANQLRTLCEVSGMRPYLVPLAYASGHDDHKALAEIKLRLGDLALIDPHGSLSSILTAFKNAKFYTGTSLHGTITAMAYGIPYYPLKRRTPKIRSYLEQWSNADGVEIFNNVRRPDAISRLDFSPSDQMRAALQASAIKLSRTAGQNLDEIAERLRA